MPAISCATCPFFDPPRKAAADVDTSQDFAGIYSSGDCRRFPQTVRKKTSEVCGEHPEFKISPRKR